jgi:hypothetical protein
MTNTIHTPEAALKHYKIQPASDLDFPYTKVGSEIYNAVVIQFIDMADDLAKSLNNKLKLDYQISSLDILDSLATVGLELNVFEEDLTEYNWPSLAYLEILKEKK